jgi:endonuclease/exonuclease/phosphatase family metal-dependent hydrolase
MKHLRMFLFLIILVCITLSALGENTSITIASFNMQNFGWGKSYCKAPQLLSLAKLLSHYDLVALQEVMKISGSGRACYGCSSTLCHLDELERSLQLLTGEQWHYVECGAMHRGTRYEYLVFLFRDTVKWLGLKGTVLDLSQNSTDFMICSFITFNNNAPVYAEFRSGNFDFMIMDVHSPSSKNTKQYNMCLGRAFDSLQESDSHEQDIIMLGDFNDRSPFFDSTATLERLPSYNYTYDAIYIDTHFTGLGHEFTGRTGIVDVDVTLSDHPLIWAEFTTTMPDDD